MNQRQARQAALKIAYAGLMQEIDNPTELTIDVIKGTGGNPDSKDWGRVREQLLIVSDQLLVKLQAFGDWDRKY